MLTPTEILEVVDTMQPIVDELKNWITRDIIRRMMARFKREEDFTLTGTDEWQVEVYKAAGGHYEALQREIQRFTKKSDREVKEIFEDIGVRAWEGDNAFYANYGFDSVSLFESESMLRLLEDTYKRTNGEIHNLTRTTAEMSQQKLIKALDSAHFKVMSGAQSYTQAVKDAVNEIIDTQATVRYPSGHIDTIETAILRAVRTGTGQASGNITMQGLIDRDWDLIRVSAHLGARYGDGGQNPSNHFWWQGKLYSRTGRTKEYPLFEEATGYGTGEGLCGWNCRHSFGPGDPNHNPYKDFDEEENKKAYDLSQKQRRAESRIRKTKTKLIGLREAIDNAQDEKVKENLQEEYNKEASKLTRYNAQYDKFCKDNNLKKLNDRISVAKWNRSEAAKARKAANNANRKAANNVNSVDKSAENGIIKIGSERGIDNQMSLAEEKRTVAGNRKSSFYVLNAKDIEYVKSEIVAIGANEEDFVFNSDITRGTCFLASDGKIHIKGNIFPDEYSSHPRDKLSIRAVLAHEYYGHRPYRKQYLAEDNDTSPEAMDRILSRAWADEFRASYMAAKNAPNLTKKDRVLLIQDSLSRAEEAGVTIKYNDFIRRVLYG